MPRSTTRKDGAQRAAILAAELTARSERDRASMRASMFGDPEPIPTPYVPGTYYPRQWRETVRTVETEPTTFAFGDVTHVIGSYPRTVTELPDGTQSVAWEPANGTPTNWTTRAPDPKALPVTPTRVTRSRKGRTSFVRSGRMPAHRTTVGETGYRDPVLDRMAWLTECLGTADDPHADGCTCALTDDRLARAADAWVAMVLGAQAKARKDRGIGAYRGSEPLPRLIGERVTRPTGVYGDRALPDLTTTDDDD